MHRFDGYDMEITRGDSLRFRLVLAGRTLPEGSEGVFTVKKHPRDETAVLQKTAAVVNGAMEITLLPEDTNLPPRTYFWDVRVSFPSGEGWDEKETPMAYAAFTVLDAIGA